MITYDRRGYARSGGEPVRNLSHISADAAALLESLQAPPAVVVGTSSGAMIALDLAVRRPDLVRAVVEYEGPWRFTRHLPTGSQVRTFATMGSFVLRGRHSDAAGVLLRSAYACRGGNHGTPSRRSGDGPAGRTEGDPVGLLISIGNHPSVAELASIDVPVVCSWLTESRFHGPTNAVARRRHPHRRIHRIEVRPCSPSMHRPTRAADRRHRHGSRW